MKQSGDTRTSRLEIRITPELKAQLQAAAAAENRSVANYLENLILQSLRKKKKESR